MTRPSPRQHHSVVRRNARNNAARGRDALTSAPKIQSQTTPQVGALDLNGRLKVVADRHVKIVVPHDFGEGKFSYEDAPNPINQMGPLHEQCVPLVTSNDYASFLAAFNKRSNFLQAGPEDDITDDALKEALQVISEIPDGLFPEWDDNDDDRQRWLSKFDPNKQNRMIAAYHDIVGMDASRIGVKDLSVKQEVLIKRDDPEWAPRVIYAGSDVFNAVTGPASCVVMERLMHLTRDLHHSIGEAKVEFAYKTDDVSLCRFLFEDDSLTETVEGDFSRNDREQRSRVAIIYDAWLEKLAMPKWFRTLMMDLEHYKVQNLRFGFRAKLAFQLATGTTSTTPRNSTYNATMFAVAIRRQSVRARAVILGDDLLAQVSKRLDLNQWVKTVCDFKMVLKAKAPKADGEATFLSRRIFREVSFPCMIPLLGKMLVRFNIRSSINDSISDSEYMAGKALSYAYECRHVPLIREIFLRRYQMEGDFKDVKMENLTWFARSSGLKTVDQIVKAIGNEKVVISNWDMGMWTCRTYDLDLEEIRILFVNTVLNADPIMLDSPELEKLKIDIS